MIAAGDRSPTLAVAVSGLLVALLAAPDAGAQTAPCPEASPRVVVEAQRGAVPLAVPPDVLREIALAMQDAGVSAAFEGDEPGVDGCALRLRATHDPAGGLLRLQLVRPGQAVLLVREEEGVVARSVLARSVVLTRDLLAAAAALPVVDPRAPTGAPAAPAVLAAAPPEAAPEGGTGKLPLAVGGAALGAFTGLGVYLATGADDPRILYPMLAAGAGVGLGGALLVAGEWNVTSADAWFVLAGGIWPTAAGHLIYEGRFADQRGPGADEERWTYGLVGTTAGLGLTTLAVALRRPTDGDAALVHSGAAYGAALGGLTEYAVRGEIRGIPEAGLGYGAAIGWLAAGTLSLQVALDPSDVLALDLGATLGGLGGAALASPLVFDDPDPAAQRAFLGIAAGSTIVGAGLGWLLTRDAPVDLTLGPGRPAIGVLGESVVGSRRAPIYGASYAAVVP